MSIIFGAMTTKNDTQPRRSRGRPSTFDRTEALNRAMKLFWEQGYEGTSFDRLIQAMGISPSSFYNSFGSKEQLYKEATDAYLSMSEVWFAGRLLGTADTREAFKKLLDANIASAERWGKSFKAAGGSRCRGGRGARGGPAAAPGARRFGAECSGSSRGLMGELLAVGEYLKDENQHPVRRSSEF